MSSRRLPPSPEAIEELLAACRVEAREIVEKHELWPEESVRVISDAILVTVTGAGPEKRLRRSFLEAIEEGCRRVVAERNPEEEAEVDVIH